MGAVSSQPVNIAAVGSKGLKIVSVFIKLFAVFPLLIGLGFLAGASYVAHGRYDVLKHWPSVDAQVTRSRLESHQETFSDKDGSHASTVYQPQIEFRYTLAGKEYTTPTKASYSSTNYPDMKLKVDQYAPGTHHAIRYNPSNPNDVRYDVAATFDYFMLPIIFGGGGLIAFVVGLGMFVFGRRLGNLKVRCPSCGEMVSASGGNCPLCGSALVSNSAPAMTSPGVPTPGT